jgi:tetratricopeptide (TPR) repeat protein
MNTVDRVIVAAQGYSELGLHGEALRLLEEIPSDNRRRVDVMEIRLLALMSEKRWEEGLKLALSLADQEPEEPGGYIHIAYCLHALGRTREALEVLLRSPDILRSKAVYYYNMGCYLATLGNTDSALDAVRRSFEMDGALKSVARKDPDLAGILPLLGL